MLKPSKIEIEAWWWWTKLTRHSVTFYEFNGEWFNMDRWTEYFVFTIYPNTPLYNKLFQTLLAKSRSKQSK